MYRSQWLQKLARLLYQRKVLGVVAVGSRQVTSVRLRLPVAPDRLELYRSLLPPELEMPAVPRIYFYISEFQETFPVKIEGGYQEAAVCLKAGCKLDSKTDPQKGGWFPLEMPVSAKSALNSGLMMGYPKYMADISLTSGNGGYDGAVKVEGREFFRMNYKPAEVEVTALEEEEMTVPFYLVVGGRINIMQNEVVEQKSFTSRPGIISLGVSSKARWTGLLDSPELKGPGVLKIITGRFNLTRRSR
ncbi:MAG TPA: acetoacetate decarboxylase family protein [bacterium]|nr:acetoacetate decarboxylase family protein [bacterium]